MLSVKALVPVQNVVEARASLEILEDRGHGHARAAQYPGAADLPWNSFDRRALRPIEDCHSGVSLHPTAFHLGHRQATYAAAGKRWQAIDYADGLVRVGVQSAVEYPETSALIRKLMEERGMPTPPKDRNILSVRVVLLCAGSN
jgi:hypothetical protein